MLTAGMMFRPHTSHYLLASFLSVGSLAQHKTHRFCHLALTKYHVVLQIHSTHRSIAVCPHILQLDRFSFIYSSLFDYRMQSAPAFCIRKLMHGITLAAAVVQPVAADLPGSAP